MIEEAELTLVGDYRKHDNKVWSLTWSPKGDTLVSTCANKEVKVWRLTHDGQLQADDTIDHEHSKTVRSAAFSPNGKLLALASFDAKISIWQVFKDTFEYVTILEGHESEVKFVDWHPTKELLVSCSRDKSIWIWEYDEELEFQCFEVLSGHAQDIKMVKWVPGTDYQLVSCSYDDSIKLWDYEDDEYFCKQTLSEHASTVWCIAFSTDGRYLVSGSEDKTIRVFTKTDQDKWALSLTISGYHERAVYSIDVFRDSLFIASGGGDDTLCTYTLKEPVTADDTLSFSLIEKKVSAHPGDINCVKFHPELRLLASCSDDGDVKLWKF